MKGIPRCVAFDCDGVLTQSVSSWKTLHRYFGTTSGDLYQAYLDGQITDHEFVYEDIKRWKATRSKIHRDEVVRAFAGSRLMPGMREVVDELKSEGIDVIIVSAGIDVYVSMIAQMLKVDDWIANGIAFDEEGWMLDEGVIRVRANNKSSAIDRVCELRGYLPEDIICVGDSSVDLSMSASGASFVGFNPTRDVDIETFLSLGVQIFEKEQLDDLKNHLLSS
ncbi:MAG TPA: HAD-IB family phosphatase [Candidatus Poseidoniales archaeon]|nr:HAD-IB family phosphatase [Candidatus Poseidoniales archaeon]